MTQTPIESIAPKTLSAIDLNPRGRVNPSPATWQDQVFYFLLPDRFSDGKEGDRPQFDRDDPSRPTANKTVWMTAGKKFVGGTLKGIESKLDYLQNLGVTTLWVGPIWKQRRDLETYHGYGIQNFLDIDPRFGTRQDLRDLVDAAHDRGMYVLLDIIYNHTGNNWFYRDENGNPVTTKPYRFSPPHDIHGWRSGRGESTSEIADIEDGVWPEEFQNWEWYTRAGQIGRWDAPSDEDPLHPDVEFRRGDFFDLKDINLSRNDTLEALIQAYQYWIALSDCDGFRIDTVKHLPWEASRNFCGAIHEYAESIGKENFMLLGEVTGGAATARTYLEIFGLNVDAVLDIGEPTVQLAGFVKGQRNPQGFFGQFGGFDALGSHRLVGQYHVSILDDHDMVGRQGKHRFSAHNSIPARYEQVAHAVGVQLTTLGIPCIYYGTEQAFDGTEDRHDFSLEPGGGFEDRYIREAMFGGLFGAFETEKCHFFDCSHPAYLRIAAIARIRNYNNETDLDDPKNLIGLALRRGRQYLRETSFLNRPFSIPGAGELVAWSRIFRDREVVVAINTNGTENRGAYVTVDASIYPPGSPLQLLYRSDWSDGQLQNPPTSETVTAEEFKGRSAVRLDLPPAGMVILAAV